MRLVDGGGADEVGADDEEPLHGCTSTSPRPRTRSRGSLWGAMAGREGKLVGLGRWMASGAGDARETGRHGAGEAERCGGAGPARGAGEWMGRWGRGGGRKGKRKVGPAVGGEDGGPPEMEVEMGNLEGYAKWRLV
jgi:hypothetical protein